MRAPLNYIFFVVFTLVTGARVTDSATLYDQYNNNGSNGVTSTNRTDSALVSSEAADDFVVPAGRSWTIQSVDFRGFPGIPPAGPITVRIYTNVGNLPGTALYTSVLLSPTGTDPDLTVALNNPPTLTAGTYWLSVQANQSSGDWYWGMRSVQSNNPAAWREGGGLGTGCTSWANRGICTGTSSVPDQMFRLIGTASPIIVTTLTDHDDGVCDTTDCTLREAIAAANADTADDTVRFAPGLVGIIQLAGALPKVSTNLVIEGPGANILTVRRNTGGNYRIFTVSNDTSDGPVVKISGLTISNGMVSGGIFPANSGAGVFNDNGSVTLSHCTLTGNSASYGGAISNVGLAGLTVRNCTLNGNTASFNGGALYNVCTAPGFAGVGMENSTLSGNGSGVNGGAISNYVALSSSTVIQIKSCTFSGNSATGAGGAIHNQRDTGTATVQIASNIFQTGASGANLVNTGGASLTSSGYNLSNDDGSGFLTATGDQINKNPMLGPLQNNGGPTFTHALLAGSPAIDKGRSFVLTTDQRGVGYLRTIDDPSILPASGGDNTDIGAFEFGAAFNAVSRKIHGATARDINLPLTGTPLGIECRRDTGADVSGPNVGRDHQLVVTFPVAVTLSGVTVSTGNPNELPSATFSVSNNVVTVDLHNIPDAPRRLTINLLDVSDGTLANNVSVPMGVLNGDTTGNGSVNASDVSQTKSKSGQAVDATNFRTDVTLSNSINSSDVSLVKSKSGTALP